TGLMTNSSAPLSTKPLSLRFAMRPPPTTITFFPFISIMIGITVILSASSTLLILPKIISMRFAVAIQFILVIQISFFSSQKYFFIHHLLIDQLFGIEKNKKLKT